MYDTEQLTGSLEEFLRRQSVSPQMIVSHRIYRPHAVNAPVRSPYYTLELVLPTCIYRIQGFENVDAASAAAEKALLAAKHF